MRAERFRELLDAHGASEERWPESVRDAMREFAAVDADAARWLQEARALDSVLDSYTIAAPDMTGRILENLPRAVVERLLAWLVPVHPRDWWRPVLAGAAPLVIGLAIGLSGIDQRFYDPGSYDWEWEERSLLAATPLEPWDE